jgi:hypothetical protein
MSGKVGTDGRAISSKGLGFMICLLARFRIGVEVIGRLALLVKAG